MASETLHCFLPTCVSTLYVPHLHFISGFPDTGIVEKRHLVSKGKPEPQLMEQQTLIDASIEEVDGQTIMKFTKIMKEAGEIEIIPGSTFTLWGYGWGTLLALHRDRGTVMLDFSSEGDGVAVPAPSESLYDIAKSSDEFSTLGKSCYYNLSLCPLDP